MTPFEVLGVADKAPLEEVRGAFRRLAMQHHPDRGGDVEKFRELQAAYDACLKLLKKCPDCQGTGVVKVKFGYGTVTEPCARCWE